MTAKLEERAESAVDDRLQPCQQPKQFTQMEVCRDVIHQIKTGQDNIFGVMIESHLVEGRQDFREGAN